MNLAAKLEKPNKTGLARGLTTRAALELAVAQGYTNAAKKEIRTQRNVAGTELPLDIVVLA